MTPDKRTKRAGSRRWLPSWFTLTPSTVTAVLALLAIVFLVAVVPFLPIYDPFTQNLSNSASRPLTTLSDGSLSLLGTDALGRDLLSRLALAGRVTMLVAFSTVAISLSLGTFLGLIAGYFGGIADRLISGLADLQLSIPRILIVIAAVAAIGPSIRNLIILLAITSWVPFARVVRAGTLSLREREFVLASVAMGATGRSIIRHHIFPNVRGQVVIIASFDLGQMVVLEATLSFLGLGVQPPNPSWGLMVNDGQTYMVTQPWMTILPGIAIFLFVAGTNILSQLATAEKKTEVSWQA